MKPFRLSANLMVKRTHLGAMVYCPVDQEKQPDNPAPGLPYLVLSDDEICHLIAWWWCRNGREIASGDMVSFVIEMVCDGRITRRTAAVMLRALAARATAEAVNNMLMGWVMPEIEGERDG